MKSHTPDSRNIAKTGSATTSVNKMTCRGNFLRFKQGDLEKFSVLIFLNMRHTTGIISLCNNLGDVWSQFPRGACGDLVMSSVQCFY